MKVVAIIPARFGSTRLEGKPIANIGGKPMVQWVYERARAARFIDDVAVATDDERVMRAVKDFGGKAVMTSASHRSGTDRIAEAVRGMPADIVVNLQGDEPLIRPDLIESAIRPMLDDRGLLISTLKTAIADDQEYRSPNVVKVVTDRDGYALYFSRSPLPFCRLSFDETSVKPFKHIGLYVYRRDFLVEFSKLAPTPLEQAESLEQLRALENGFRIRVVEAAYSPVAVDTEEDLEKVRRLVEAGHGRQQA